MAESPPTTTSTLTAAAGAGPAAGPAGQRIEGVVVEVSDEPPTRGAVGVAWVATVPGSSSILDLRGLVLWPGTSIAGSRSRPGPGCDLAPGDRVRARASETEYWSIPPMFDALRIERDGPEP